MYRIINDKIDCRIWISIRNNLLVNIDDQISKECNIFMEHVINGFIISINAGTSSGYTSAPTVSLTTAGGGSGANITCVLSGNTIGAFTIVAAGTGYISTTPVTITQTGATASGYVATVSATGTITAHFGPRTRRH